MRNDTFWRLLVVAAVTLFCGFYVAPTLEYFLLKSSSSQATPKGADDLERLRARSVPLGLDLQGGVDVLLAVDLEKARLTKAEALADELRASFKRESPVIDAAVDVTTVSALAANDPGVRLRLTLAKAEQERSADNVLARLRERGEFPDYANLSVKAGQPLTLVPSAQSIRADAERTVDSVLNVLRGRVDRLGVTQPVVVKQGADRIRVQIPGERDPQKVVATIIKPAVLEFREVLSERTPDAEGRYGDASGEFIDLKTGKPLPGKAIPAGYAVFPYKKAVPSENATPEQRAKAAAQPDRHILLGRKPRLNGDAVADAFVTMGQSSIGMQEVQVILNFTPAGTDTFGRVTTELVNHRFAIVLDGTVYSDPNIMQRITGGTCNITGGFNMEEARNLSLILKAGALPAELKTLDQRTVEATLGADSIRSSIRALGVGSVIVALVMAVYYGAAGLVAVIAVALNVLIVFAFMRLAGATLTLSGIGGILLTVGMAVDANILIYERIREEMRAGRKVRQAVQIGFSRAFTVIFDTNITTLISGLTLLQFGEGSVKGFALTLIIGIIASLFTGLFVTRALFDFWLSKRPEIGLGRLRVFSHDVNVDFVKLRRFSFPFSIGLFLLSCVTLAIPAKPLGIHWGVDFDGGILAEVKTAQDTPAHVVAGGFGDMRVQKVAGDNRLIVRLKNEGRALADSRAELAKRLDRNVGAGKYTLLSTESMSTEVGKEFTLKAVLACLIASVLILAYISFKFEFSYGLSAVIALFHDLVITFGLFNLLAGMHLAGEVTLDVVAALLVVLGFSVHDTIIILDRVRENRKLHPGLGMKELINLSINETLNRTVMTVSTVLLVLLVMLTLGGAGLFDFALVLFIGILKGTYSSSFVAAPILYELYERARRKGKDIHRPAPAAKPALLPPAPLGRPGGTGRQPVLAGGKGR